jgi:hypothetical protein
MIKEKLIFDPARGRVIKKELLPKIYLKKYGNKTFFLWNLTGSWRLIYFLAREEDKQLIIIVDWRDQYRSCRVNHPVKHICRHFFKYPSRVQYGQL